MLIPCLFHAYSMLILCLFYAWGPRITATCAGGSLRDSAVSKVVPVAFSDAGRVSVIYVASTRLHIGTTAISSLFFLLLSLLLVSRALLYIFYIPLCFFSHICFPSFPFSWDLLRFSIPRSPFPPFSYFVFLPHFTRVVPWSWKRPILWPKETSSHLVLPASLFGYNNIRASIQQICLTLDRSYILLVQIPGGSCRSGSLRASQFHNPKLLFFLLLFFGFHDGEKFCSIG